MSTRINRDNQAGHQRRWLAHVKALAESGLSRAEYCRQHDLSYHALTYWQRKFPKPANRTTTLVPVPLQSKFKPHVMHSDRGGLQLILPGGISLAVGDNFSPATLTRLLTVLENR